MGYRFVNNTQINFYKMLTCIKYILLLLTAVIAAMHSGELRIIPVSALEIIFVIYISNILLKKYKKTGYVVNVILSFVFLLQQGVLYFSGEYISQMMVDNLSMIGNLGSMLTWYIISAIVLLIISLIPCKHFSVSFLKGKVMIAVLAVYVCLVLFMYQPAKMLYSPYLMFCKTSKNLVLASINKYRYSISDDEKKQIFRDYYKDSIRRSDIVIKQHIPQNPNVIVLFVEGMSMEVLDVANDMNLNLTPNLDEFYHKSIAFKNYYNHTAATFAGLKGQLYSGFFFQHGDLKVKRPNLPDWGIDGRPSRLISLVDILKKHNYTTSFINVEPQSETIVDYVNTLRFDSVYSNGITDRRLSDKEAFQLLESVVTKSEKPFFVSWYNIGTHHGFDSPDVKYGDGKNEVLNRFHNFDAQFGIFFNNLLKNGLLDNTILVVTTDHASYSSPEFKNIFKNTSGHFIDKIPLMVYWNGVKPDVIDVDGRNSVDFAPTIMDIMNINNENYFLGTSLFIKEKNSYNTSSAILSNHFYYTGNNKVEPVFDDYMKYMWEIFKYYSISDND